MVNPPAMLRGGERLTAPQHAAERVGVGVNRRVGSIRVPAGDPDLFICHFDPKDLR
jgi:hypothetical protein